MTNILRLVLTVGILVSRISAQGLPFPCVIEEPCENFLDPSGMSDPCGGRANIICRDTLFQAICPITCHTCTPCSEPERIPGFDAVVQSVATTDTQVVVQLLTSMPFAGASFQTFCVLESGEEAFVETLSGSGGVESAGFSLNAGVQGRWVVSPRSDNTVVPGFFSLMVLETENLSAKRCKEGSVNLQNGVLFHPEGRPISFCGGGDNRCPTPEASRELRSLSEKSRTRRPSSEASRAPRSLETRRSPPEEPARPSSPPDESKRSRSTVTRRSPPVEAAATRSPPEEPTRPSSPPDESEKSRSSVTRRSPPVEAAVTRSPPEEPARPSSPPDESEESRSSVTRRSPPEEPTRPLSPPDESEKSRSSVTRPSPPDEPEVTRSPPEEPTRPLSPPDESEKSRSSVTRRSPPEEPEATRSPPDGSRPRSSPVP